eukprot:248964_1
MEEQKNEQHKQPQEGEQEVKLQINSNIEKTKLETYSNSTQPLFKWHRVCPFVVSLGLVLGVAVIVIIYYVRKDNKIRYCIVAAISYMISVLMSIMINGNDISLWKRRLFLVLSFILMSGVLVGIVCGVRDVSFSGFISITCTTCSYNVIFIIFCYQYAQKKNVKYALEYVWNIKSLLVPVLMHFADIATDIGSTMEYYARSTTNATEENENNISYHSIFTVSIFILLFYRVVGSIIVFEFTRSRKDALLQFFEVFLLKTLWKEWELGRTQSGRVHKWLDLIESIFESGPQCIISMYILWADSNFSLVIWISTVLSMISLASKTITQDNMYFSSKMKAKEHGFKREVGCGDGRFLCCNWRWLFRVIWRIIDITGFILLCSGIWLSTNGGYFISFIVALFVFFVPTTIVFWCCIGGFNMHYLNGLLACPISGSFANGARRPLPYMVVFRLAMILIFVSNSFSTEGDQYILWIIILVMMIWTVIGYVMMTMLDWSVFLIDTDYMDDKISTESGKGCGKNWIDASVDSSLSLASCNSKEEIYNMLQEGMDIRHGFREIKSWQFYPRPTDLIDIADELNVELRKGRVGCDNTENGLMSFNPFIAIGKNKVLDQNVDETEIKRCIVRLKEIYRIGSTGRDGPLYWACLYHSDTKWIRMLWEEGASYGQECIRHASYNATPGKDKIIRFFVEKIEERDRELVKLMVEIEKNKDFFGD